MKLSRLKSKNIHIVGLSGAEGSSLALFLINQGFKNLTGHDFKESKEFQRSFFNYHDNLTKKQKLNYAKKISQGLSKINYKKSYLKDINQADIIFAPASWFRYQENYQLKRYANSKKIKFWNWYNLLLEFFKAKVVGVTGTAGKGTVSNLIYHILKTAKKKCFLVGESWHFTDWQKIFKTGKEGIVIAELNNRTLKFAKYSKKSPALAIITNIFPNHLDDHHNSFLKYKKTKLEIVKYQKKGQLLIINKDDAELREITWPPRTIFYSLAEGGALTLVANPYFNHQHLLSDALAAIKIAEQFKINQSVIKKAIKNFKPRFGRMEFIKNLKGRQFINDAAATRPKATRAALESLAKQKIILILEGSRKNPTLKEFQELRDVIIKNKVKAVLISGLITSLAYPLIKKRFKNIFKTKNLKASVNKAYQLSQAGDLILLSPAGESFGEFQDYRERSKKFQEIVKNLK